MPARAQLALVVGLVFWLATAVWGDEGTLFREQVAPVFERRCVQCLCERRDLRRRPVSPAAVVRSVPVSERVLCR